MNLGMRTIAVALTVVGLLSGPALVGGAGAPPANAHGTRDVGSRDAAEQAFRHLESRYGARLGVYALDLGTGREVGHRTGERFAFASTFKALVTGVMLADLTIDPEQAIPVTADMLVPNSPITEQHVGGTMTLAEAADAALRFSDNTAANIILDRVGGPAGFQAALRALGDTTLRSDRREPELNDWTPGDDRDTSTPRAMAASLRLFALGDTLTPERRDMLVGWMKENTTGDELIRAGVPAGSIVADKTGSASFGARNDIAVVWPPRGGPVVIAVMTNRFEEDADYNNALIADATRVAWKALGR